MQETTAKQLKEFILANCRSWLAEQDPREPGMVDAFMMADVLGIALCKSTSNILVELVKR